MVTCQGRQFVLKSEIAVPAGLRNEGSRSPDTRADCQANNIFGPFTGCGLSPDSGGIADIRQLLLGTMWTAKVHDINIRRPPPPFSFKPRRDVQTAA
jgi:hypothetical protein